MSSSNSPVPAFVQILTSLSTIIGKAEAHAAAKNIQPEALLNARLFPDMFTFTRQIQIVCDFAGKNTARLAKAEVPSTPDTEKSFGELKKRIDSTIDYLKKFKSEQFDGIGSREVEFPVGPGKTATLNAQQALTHFFLPNFYFHAATAYDILRHNGVELGKRDFIGSF